MPPWAHIAADEEILLDAAESVSSILSLVDVFLVGYFTQLLEFRELTECSGPIVYWDQGHEHVFGDPSAHPEWDRVFHQVMHLPIVLLSVSDIIRDILLVHFARVAPVVPNAIDAILFRPVDAHRRQLARSNRIRGLELSADTRHVLLVGNPALPLKNHHIALQALNRVAARIPLHLTWICQVQPVISGLLFPVTFAVDPAQEELPALYAGGYDVFVFPSLYEAWGMPVLEVSSIIFAAPTPSVEWQLVVQAMASGVPAVVAQCHGVDMFCRDRDNCLMVSPYEPEQMAGAIEELLMHPEVRIPSVLVHYLVHSLPHTFSVVAAGCGSGYQCTANSRAIYMGHRSREA
jgi:glycosyltransferase involved in cell wall biosynthesis